MTTGRTTNVFQHLRRTALLQGGAGLTDGQLLGRFVEQRDEAAFAALVRRHGPMVWGVCRRVLGHHQDAEDAFQAAFLVLVRKAASVVPRDMVGSWLYGVAHTTAIRAKALAAKRRARERPVTHLPDLPAAPAKRDRCGDLLPLLDQQLTLLPDKYRVAVVLCDLEGKSIKEAARHLGWPQGTLAGRLARARALLAKRLARHGLAVSGGALAAMLSPNVASAVVPTSVVSSTIKAARLFTAGQAAATGVISVKVAALTEGVLQAMLLHKIKTAVLVCLVLAAVGIGLSGLVPRGQAEGPPPDWSKGAPPRQDEGNLKETVLALQKRIWEANAKQDLAAMTSLLAPDFAGLDKHGNPFNKQEELRYVSAWCEFDHSVKEARVILLNDSSAIVMYEVHYRVRPSKSREVRFVESRQGTAAWAKRNGQWWYVYKESHPVSPEKQPHLPLQLQFWGQFTAGGNGPIRPEKTRSNGPQQ
jgi:RNA polymerase sigma factor (sigma-70 family)